MRKETDMHNRHASSTLVDAAQASRSWEMRQRLRQLRSTLSRSRALCQACTRECMEDIVHGQTHNGLRVDIR
jgi:hypothetical protein